MPRLKLSPRNAVNPDHQPATILQTRLCCSNLAGLLDLPALHERMKDRLFVQKVNLDDKKALSAKNACSSLPSCDSSRDQNRETQGPAYRKWQWKNNPRKRMLAPREGNGLWRRRLLNQSQARASISLNHQHQSPLQDRLRHRRRPAPHSHRHQLHLYLRDLRPRRELFHRFQVVHFRLLTLSEKRQRRLIRGVITPLLMKLSQLHSRAYQTSIRSSSLSAVTMR